MKRYVIAFITACAVVLVIFPSAYFIQHEAYNWASQGVEISFANRLLMGLSTFWLKFWILLAPLIGLFALAVACILHVFSELRSRNAQSSRPATRP